MTAFYFPAWNGDHRLVAEGDDACRLVVQDPSPNEIEALGKFMTAAVKKKWSRVDQRLLTSGDAYRGLDGGGLLISAPISKAGPLLLRLLKPGKAVLTAIKYESGRVSVVESGAPAALEKIEKALEKKEERAEAAATVRRPRLCCPSCVALPEDARAEGVLGAFLGRRQREQWESEHRFTVFGGETGHLYEISHRRSPRAQAQRRIVRDLDDGVVLHCYDWTVPPAEEALAAALILEHREPWLRNGATLFHAMHARSIFENPFVPGVMDGADEDGKLHQAVGIATGALVSAAVDHPFGIVGALLDDE